jgi:hypothetical protein
MNDQRLTIKLTSIDLPGTEFNGRTGLLNGEYRLVLQGVSDERQNCASLGGGDLRRRATLIYFHRQC